MGCFPVLFSSILVAGLIVVLHRLKTFFNARDGQLRELLKGNIVSLIVRALSGFSGLAVTYIVTQVFGLDEAGTFFICLTLLLVITVISQVGIDLSLTKVISKFIAGEMLYKIRDVYLSCFLIVVLSSSFFAILVFSFSFLISNNVFSIPDMEIPLKIFAISIVPSAISWMNAHCFQGMNKIIFYALFQNLLINVLFFVLILLGKCFFEKYLDLSGVSYLYLASAIGSALASTTYLMIKIKFNPFLVKLNFDDIFKTSPAFFATTVFTMLSAWSPQLLLGIYGSANGVAVFSVSTRVAALISLILMAVNSVSFPKYAAFIYSDDIESLKRYAAHTARLSTVISLFPLTIALIYAGEILSIFGDDYKTGKFIFIVLLFGQFFNVATGSVGGILGMTGYQNRLLFSSVVSALTCVFLGFLLVPSFGEYGAAISSAISLVVLMSLNSWFVYKKYNFLPIFY